MRAPQKKLKPTMKPFREGYRVVIPQNAAKGEEVFREQNRACLRSSNNGIHTLIRCLLVAPLEVLPPTRQVLLFLHGFALRGMVVVMMGRGFGASRASGSGRGTARCHAGLPHALELMANAMRLVRMLYRHARGASRSAGVRGRCVDAREWWWWLSVRDRREGGAPLSSCSRCRYRRTLGAKGRGAVVDRHRRSGEGERRAVGVGAVQVGDGRVR